MSTFQCFAAYLSTPVTLWQTRKVCQINPSIQNIMFRFNTWNVQHVVTKDCARSYGRSEEFMSAWLKTSELKKEDVAVGSKCRLCTWNWMAGSQMKEGKKLLKKVEIWNGNWFDLIDVGFGTVYLEWLIARDSYLRSRYVYICKYIYIYTFYVYDIYCTYIYIRWYIFLYIRMNG